MTNAIAPPDALPMDSFSSIDSVSGNTLNIHIPQVDMRPPAIKSGNTTRCEKSMLVRFPKNKMSKVLANRVKTDWCKKSAVRSVHGRCLKRAGSVGMNSCEEMSAANGGLSRCRIAMEKNRKSCIPINHSTADGICILPSCGMCV